MQYILRDGLVETGDFWAALTAARSENNLRAYFERGLMTVRGQVLRSEPLEGNEGFHLPLSTLKEILAGKWGELHVSQTRH